MPLRDQIAILCITCGMPYSRDTPAISERIHRMVS
jgi:hypothetical protein